MHCPGDREPLSPSSLQTVVVSQLIQTMFHERLWSRSTQVSHPEFLNTSNCMKKCFCLLKIKGCFQGCYEWGDMGRGVEWLCFQIILPFKPQKLCLYFSLYIEAPYRIVMVNLLEMSAIQSLLQHMCHKLATTTIELVKNGVRYQKCLKETLA